MAVSDAVRIYLPKPHAGQRKILGKRKRFNVWDCGRRYGKSTGGEIVASETFIEGGPVGWFTPGYKYLDEIWPVLKNILAPLTLRVSEQSHRIEGITGGILEAWSLDGNPNAGRSRKYKRVIVDEASVAENLDVAWPQAIYSTLMDLSGDAYIMGTPKGKNNYFFDLFKKGREEFEEYDPSWISWQLPTHDNPYIPVAELEEFRRQNGDLLYAQEILAEFVDIDDMPFVPIEAWDQCYDEEIQPLQPGDRDPIVLALDAAVSHDTFSIAAVGRHPKRHDDPAVRGCRIFAPSMFHNSIIDFSRVERYIRWLCLGGCKEGHPVTETQDIKDNCFSCRAGEHVERLNVVKIVYDPYQLHDMGQRLRRESVAWTAAFSQNADRLEADSDLRRLILSKRLAHNGEVGCKGLREHVLAAAAKIDTEQARQVRIVKMSIHRHIDALVATSMATHECLRLNI